MSQKHKTWLMGAGVLVLIVAIAGFMKSAPKADVPAVTHSEAIPGTTEEKKPAAAPVNSAPKAPSNSGGNVVPLTKTGTTILVTPGEGEAYVQDENNTIRWSHAAGVNGEIVLLNQDASQAIGWIAPSLAPGQVTYSWDGLGVLIQKTSPTKKNVNPGTYRIRISFDNQPSIVSAPFTLKADGNPVSLARMVTIKNSFFSPSYLELKAGERLVFVNAEAATRTLVLGTGGIVKLAPSDSHVLALAPGTYEYRLSENAVTATTVVVK